MEAVCRILGELVEEGILEDYAIGGATAAGFHPRIRSQNLIFQRKVAKSQSRKVAKGRKAERER